jgi:hypothetical protein
MINKGMSEVITIEDIQADNEFRRVAKFLRKGDTYLSLDYFVTLHLSKSKQQVAEHHISYFRNVLDRKIYGKHRRLYKAVFIEEGKNATSRSYNERHCHMLIEKPKHLTLKQYKKEFNTLWEEICGSDDITWQRITNKKGGVGGLIDYCNKEIKYGIKAFTEELSDNSYQQKNRNKAHH